MDKRGPASPATPWWPFPLFVVSGFAALVLETVLLRQLALLFGNSARATSLVLAAFMGGLALGAWWFGARVDRSDNPLKLFGQLEIGAAVSGALLVWLLGSGRDLFLAPLRLLGSGSVERLAEFTLAFLLVLVPTTLMGGTLPALGRAVIRSPTGFAARLGALYGMNTLGAALGVFVAGFFLFEALGVSRAAYVGAALQLLVGLGAVVWSRGVRLPAIEVDRALGQLRTDDDAPEVRRRRIAATVAAAAGGFAVLGYEVIWTRLLSLFMRSFSYSFSLMLSLFLIGLFLGALLVPIAGRRLGDPLRTAGWLLVAMGVWVAGSVVWMSSSFAPIGAESFEGFLWRSVLRAAPVVLPPTILSGMALPLAAAGFARGATRVGQDVGRIYAANTVGAIGGALAGGLLLLPRLGAPGALILLATVNVLAGVAVLAALGVRRWEPIAAGVVAVLCVAPATGANERFVHGFLQATRNADTIGDVLYFHEGAVDTIAIVQRTYGFRDAKAKSLITNGVAMSATVKPVWRYMAAEGHLPLLFVPRPKKALAVGVGTGITLGALASHPELESIVAVELSDGVAAGLDHFLEENGGAHRDPRVRLLREDGRHFLELTQERFDAITLEPPPPIVAGSTHLYSREFYELCAERLTEGGVVAQWLPLHAQSLESARMVARTFADAFPHVQLWLPSVRDAVLIGSREPLTIHSDRIRDAWSTPETRRNLARAYFETAESLLATFFYGGEGLAAWFGAAPPITDEHPRMEFFRHQGGNMTDREISGLLEPPQEGWGFLNGVPDGYDSLLQLENRALRLYVRSIVDRDPNARVNAARLGLGTEFFLYPMGCTREQLDALVRDPAGTPDPAGHREMCRRLRELRDTARSTGG